LETVLQFAAGIAVGVILLYLLGISVAPYRPNPIKNDHFECGLPPSSEVPMKANFDYFVFGIAFIVFDMAGLFFSLFAFSDSASALKWAIGFGILLFVAITVAMKEYRDGKNT